MATALKPKAAKPKKLTAAQYNKAFQNGMRQAELRHISGQAAQQNASRVAAKLWPTPAQDK